MNYGNTYTNPQMGYPELPPAKPTGMPVQQQTPAPMQQQPFRTIPNQYMSPYPTHIYQPQPMMQTQTPGYPQMTPMTTQFNPMCKECQGRGITKKGKPCKICYAQSGMCSKCNGTGLTRKGKPCEVCYFKQNVGSCTLCKGKAMISGKAKPCVMCRLNQKFEFRKGLINSS